MTWASTLYEGLPAEQLNVALSEICIALNERQAVVGNLTSFYTNIGEKTYPTAAELEGITLTEDGDVAQNVSKVMVGIQNLLTHNEHVGVNPIFIVYPSYAALVTLEGLLSLGSYGTTWIRTSNGFKDARLWRQIIETLENLSFLWWYFLEADGDISSRTSNVWRCPGYENPPYPEFFTAYDMWANKGYAYDVIPATGTDVAYAQAYRNKVQRTPDHKLWDGQYFQYYPHTDITFTQGNNPIQGGVLAGWVVFKLTTTDPYNWPYLSSMSLIDVAVYSGATLLGYASLGGVSSTVVWIKSVATGTKWGGGTLTIVSPTDITVPFPGIPFDESLDNVYSIQSSLSTYLGGVLTPGAVRTSVTTRLRVGFELTYG